MASPNPLTIVPASDIDADYTLFISHDLDGDTVTVRWATDFMPNHGFRLERNGAVIKERIDNALPASITAPEIFVQLNSKSRGGVDGATTPRAWAEMQRPSGRPAGRQGVARRGGETFVARLAGRAQRADEPVRQG